MRFSLIHLAEVPCEGEEVLVVLPGGTKTAIAVTLDALPQLLPLLAQAAEDLPPPCCPACSAPLPAGIDEPDMDTCMHGAPR
jgi:hypothetical protein